MGSPINPELQLLRTRPERTVNTKTVQRGLFMHYQARARAVGLTLQQYCQRFGIRQTWTGVI